MIFADLFVLYVIIVLGFMCFSLGCKVFVFDLVFFVKVHVWCCLFLIVWYSFSVGLCVI